MADVFVEYMITRRPSLKVTLQKALLSFAALVVALLPFFLSNIFQIDLTMLFPFTLVGAGWGMIILFRRLNLEFEYIVTNGEMDVDKIMGKSTRKRVLTVDCRNFDILAPCKEEYKGDMESAAISKRVDASSAPYAPGRWFAVFNGKDGARTLLIFEPNERMLEAFKTYIPRKIRS